MNTDNVSNYVKYRSCSFDMSRALTKRYSTSFYSASNLFSEDIRPAIHSIYASYGSPMRSWTRSTSISRPNCWISSNAHTISPTSTASAQSDLALISADGEAVRHPR
ncbi:hypothetical protein [Porphyromonas cangingivalis]|uniref:hypothetical protein n=1 Tax=Porphyromonas cangingivalis TaxID=36874 RepID=UPI001F23A866|nr:hypothetical protein [Porphyromonas cangingivalis]